MKVLFIHNKYQIRGGEDKVFEQECLMLKNYGHEIKVLLVDNDTISSVTQKILAAFRVTWSNWGLELVEQELKYFKPDIVHVHNFFPLLSPSIFSVFNRLNIPCVMTLHNYRIICPTATLVVNGKVNEHSLSRSSYWLVPKKFYKNSFIGSLFLARMVEYHKKKGTWKNNVDKFIALTDFARNKFIESGIPQNKIVVKPNFVQQTCDDGTICERKGALFVGRISPEKGVMTLLHSWKNIDYPLTIAGGGVTNEMKKLSSKNVSFLGNVHPEEISKLMRKASFLVMPSEWYEGFPMVLVEAYFNKLPVIASDIGSLSELVLDDVTGYKFIPGDAKSLRQVVNMIIENPDIATTMGNNAFERANKLYNMSENYKTLLNIYNALVAKK